MGKSSYTKHAELNEVIAKRENALRKCIGENREAALALDSLLLNLEKKRKLIEAENHQALVRYTEACKNWRIKHFTPSLTSDSMERGMTEPNIPNYIRANND